ncbi:MAG: AraC family transcriptional regulator [Bacteroidota bacterium]|nr:AraC family transcriptional regulator [Bacteroidota bacterium]
MNKVGSPPQIITSCYYKKTRKGENIVSRHAFAYQLSGSLIVKDGKETVIFEPGDFRFNVRNKLAKFVKQPAEDQAFQSISLSFDEQTLREFAQEYHYTSDRRLLIGPSIQLKKHPYFKTFMDSLQLSMPYFNSNDHQLVKLKLKEALVVLMKVHPELKDILFDFENPGKINLPAFMEENFRYKLSLSRMAYLTGRSISGFKRDFDKAFGMTPAKWLQLKRLEEAYFLLSEKKQRITDVYAEVGFENLSHFSYVFKKHFGINPAAIAGRNDALKAKDSTN